MTKYFKLALFIGLMEYQVLLTPGEYSPVTALGLILLCLLQLYSGRTGFRIDGMMKKIDYKAIVPGGTFVIILAYVGALLSSVLIFKEFGHQFFFALFVTLVGVVALSVSEYFKHKKSEQITAAHPNKMGSFTIPIIFVYMINHLLSVQLESNLSYQFILVLSALVLYDIFFKGTKFALQFERGEINEHEFQHYLFHRWSKYLNYFLAIWYFLTLRANGIIDASQESLMMFTFSVAFFTFIFRMVAKFTIKDFITIVIIAGALTALNPLISTVMGLELAHFMRAIILFLFFDLYDIYIHSRNFVDTHSQIWGQKTVIYILVTLFVMQLQILESNPGLTIENTYTSITEGTTVAAPTINVSDEENSYKVREE